VASVTGELGEEALHDRSDASQFVAVRLRQLGQHAQNLAATLTLAQRVYIINNGHIVHEGPAQEIRAQPGILQRYLGL
jgi:branched-chain amino acid transport system ATP-binding protein